MTTAVPSTGSLSRLCSMFFPSNLLGLTANRSAFFTTVGVARLTTNFGQAGSTSSTAPVDVGHGACFWNAHAGEVCASLVGKRFLDCTNS
jgi:hypothetical protein